MPSRGGQPGSFVTPYQLTMAYGDARARIARGTGADWFGPLDPLAPAAPPDVASRQWDFPSGYNLNITPRVYEPITFATLRGLADGYDLLRLIIETRKDQVARMGWSIKPRDATAADTNDPQAQAVAAFLKRPDGVHVFGDWLRLLLEDLFVIDAPTLYMQRDRGGRLIALLPLDGATIKPVIDDWGRTPQPFVQDGALVYPAAYQQVLKGYPAIDYSVRDILYRPRNIRVDKAYGYSPVEQIVTTVGIALRKQLFTLEYYTSGNIPDSLIGVPETWTPDQIANYQKYWDAYVEGDLGRRRKAKFVPGGVAKTFIQTKEPQLKDDFDEWLARVCCFAFSVSPQALVKQMNRASANTQKEIAQEEGLWPVLNWVKNLIDDVIEKEFGAPQLEFCWAQGAQIDPVQQASVLSTYVKAGVLTINEARAQMGLAPLSDAAANQPMTLTASGYQPIGAASSPHERGETGPPKLTAARASGGVPRPEPVEGRRSAADLAGIHKFNPYHVPAGNGRASGQFASGSSTGTPNDGVYRPGTDGAPKLTLVQEDEPDESDESERTPAELEALALSRQNVQAALQQVQALDPNWRPPDTLTGIGADGQPSVADQLANDQEIIAAAQARVNELLSQGADSAGGPLDRSNMQDKLQNYVLKPDHLDNGGKAPWFKSVLGFDQSNWQDLADQIYWDESKAVPGKVDSYGQRYELNLVIRGANGRTANVSFGFNKDWNGVVRLMTAYAGPK